jgi:hypothetical protein
METEISLTMRQPAQESLEEEEVAEGRLVGDHQTLVAATATSPSKMICQRCTYLK